MNMDYSKAFELLNQDAEKERNKKAEKAVHDNLYNKGFRDGLAALDKIYADIQTLRGCSCSCSDGIIDDVEDILDKYKAESEG